MTYISSLTLNAFRNYDTASVDGLGDRFVILIGENGAGKTNCMEAISLLSPGRGLRGASVPDCQSSTLTTPWAVSASIIDPDGDDARLGVGRDPQKTDKKIVRHNGETVKSQQDLGDILRTVWLTPQMDGLFMQGTSEKRRFFDRLVASFDAGHTGRMTRFEKAMRERLNLLKTSYEKQTPLDATWVKGLENIMAETAVAIAAGRNNMLNILQTHIDTLPYADFPKAQLSITGDAENDLEKSPALAVEDHMKHKLEQTRQVDGLSGRTAIGAHRLDFNAFYTDKNVNAAQCSTGEQKSLLTSIILAHASMVEARFGAPPLLLFDEICAHFDEKRRDALFEILGHFNAQIWLSGQDQKAFQTINDKSLISVQNNTLSNCAKLQ